jgi:Flp pilus assembly protein TadG
MLGSARSTYRRSRDESGVVMMEYILIFPLLILIFFATLDINQFLRANQIASVLSRESAARALRRCATLMRTRDGAMDVARTGTAVQTCLNRVTQEIQGVLPTNNNYEVRVTVFRFIPNDPATTANEQTVVSYSATTNPAVKTFSLSGGTVRAGGQDVVTAADLQSRRVVAAAEIEYSFTPVLLTTFDIGGTTIKQLFNPSTRFIDATIL